MRGNALVRLSVKPLMRARVRSKMRCRGSWMPDARWMAETNVPFPPSKILPDGGAGPGEHQIWAIACHDRFQNQSSHFLCIVDRRLRRYVTSDERRELQLARSAALSDSGTFLLVTTIASLPLHARYPIEKSPTTAGWLKGLSDLEKEFIPSSLQGSPVCFKTQKPQKLRK
ncbi:hypothetical protein K402DRAFT_32064 [Aulographum hederae CBS 113979]|uniref:Uncharacterized protein n=1 Tax=Aulographum hederae CBS 113979 TaxID=1176131 RepID=A0A6G1H4W4_9PEZI|nr:hypothetical protein K402DRAFT_32064 [Aulographum hederae CBS 113979]